jgi:hypothetical protein
MNKKISIQRKLPANYRILDVFPILGYGYPYFIY